MAYRAITKFIYADIYPAVAYNQNFYHFSNPLTQLHKTPCLQGFNIDFSFSMIPTSSYTSRFILRFLWNFSDTHILSTWLRTIFHHRFIILHQLQSFSDNITLFKVCIPAKSSSNRVMTHLSFCSYLLGLLSVWMTRRGINKYITPVNTGVLIPG